MNLLDHPSLAGLKHVSSTDGGEWCGVCPKCGGRDRFHVWPNKGASGKFWCRGCGWSGDGIQFLRDLEGLSYPEACRRLGTAPRTGRRPMVVTSKRPEGMSDSQVLWRLQEIAYGIYHAKLEFLAKVDELAEEAMSYVLWWPVRLW